MGPTFEGKMATIWRRFSAIVERTDPTFSEGRLFSVVASMPDGTSSKSCIICVPKYYGDLFGRYSYGRSAFFYFVEALEHVLHLLKIAIVVGNVIDKGA